MAAARLSAQAAPVMQDQALAVDLGLPGLDCLV